MLLEEESRETSKPSQPLRQGDNDNVSQTSGSADQNAFDNRQLADETIEQEAELSNHSNAADLDVTDTTEPAPPGTPKSIANDDDRSS